MNTSKHYCFLGLKHPNIKTHICPHCKQIYCFICENHITEECLKDHEVPLVWIYRFNVNDNNYIVKPFIKRYSLNLLSVNHITSDLHLFDMFRAGISFANDFLIQYGFNKVVLMACRNIKGKHKEHQHLRIVFPKSEYEQFNLVFSSLTNKTIEEGFLDRKLIVNKSKKNKESKDGFVSTDIYNGNIRVNIPKNQLSNVFATKDNFLKFINDVYIKEGKGVFNHMNSEVYWFAKIKKSDHWYTITKSWLSSGD